MTFGCRVVDRRQHRAAQSIRGIERHTESAGDFIGLRERDPIDLNECPRVFRDDGFDVGGVFLPHALDHRIGHTRLREKSSGVQMRLRRFPTLAHINQVGRQVVTFQHRNQGTIARMTRQVHPHARANPLRG